MKTASGTYSVGGSGSSQCRDGEVWLVLRQECLPAGRVSGQWHRQNGPWDQLLMLHHCHKTGKVGFGAGHSSWWRFRKLSPGRRSVVTAGREAVLGDEAMAAY